MKRITLPCYDIKIELYPDPDFEEYRGGLITSNLKYDDPAEIDEVFEDGHEFEIYEASIDALESLILAHACAGVNIESEGYIKGIETAVEAISNNT